VGQPTWLGPLVRMLTTVCTVLVVVASSSGVRAAATSLLAFALSQLGAVARDEGDIETARQNREESAALAQMIGDRIVLGLALAGLADLARLRGDIADAQRLFSEALSVSSELGPFWRVVPRALSGLAGVALLTGDNVRSAHLFGAAAALWESSGKRELMSWRRIVDADIAYVHARLGDEPFAAAWTEGHALRMDEALDYALERPSRTREA
jgi:tetratricopeptide (TPR) repeat protein